MQSTLEEHQGQLQRTSSLHQPEFISPPEPVSEPMQLENNRLTFAERQRWLTQGLCLYCGASGHVRSTCPTRPPRPIVSAIIPSIKKMKPLSTIVVTVEDPLSHSVVCVCVCAVTLIVSCGLFSIIQPILCPVFHFPVCSLCELRLDFDLRGVLFLYLFFVGFFTCSPFALGIPTTICTWRLVKVPASSLPAAATVTILSAICV
ncbi:hypothetical protein DPX16_22918 [Anabarilius grahami]|uniref:CCHC-type domain-containing protein n=1 Tax=Anabarilius grahami TaxID=495550 RepID=A0A3N0YFH7_ANAGA|nr:hypothetical protein DPX16_22918 [Anabarilius grahami]